MDRPRHLGLIPEVMWTRLPKVILAAKKMEAGIPFWGVLAIKPMPGTWGWHLARGASQRTRVGSQAHPPLVGDLGKVGTSPELQLPACDMGQHEQPRH